jgi:hypothetical protein
MKTDRLSLSFVNARTTDTELTIRRGSLSVEAGHVSYVLAGEDQEAVHYIPLAQLQSFRLLAGA